jgi:hypothetical protein
MVPADRLDQLGLPPLSHRLRPSPLSHLSLQLDQLGQSHQSHRLDPLALLGPPDR